MAMAKRSTVASCFAVAVLTALVAPMPALAQSACDVDELPREIAGRSQLAIRIDRGWQFFAPNDGAPAHVLQTDGLQDLCLAWEAPPYQRINRQIVYASTQYRDDQPLWLFRNSAAAEIPFIGRLLGDWSRTADASGANPDDSFREFHRSFPADPDVAPWSDLTDWHDTSAWLANRRSYELVSGAAAELTLLPYGTERLLVLAGQRPLTSWVPFTTYAPSGQDEFRVAVSYSGDLDDLGPRLYQYVFEAR